MTRSPEYFSPDLWAASPSCTFCSIIAGKLPAVVVREWPGVIAIEPRHPVTPGHVLVIPHAHVEDAGRDPAVSALTMSHASELVGELDDANIITSRGPAATQTQFHLHLHVVPRMEGDGLVLPWAPAPGAVK